MNIMLDVLQKKNQNRFKVTLGSDYTRETQEQNEYRAMNRISTMNQQVPYKRAPRSGEAMRITKPSN